MLLNTSALVAAIRRTAQLPNATVSSLTDDDILAETQRALEASVVPFVAQVQEEYFVLHQSYHIQQNQLRLTLPRRAMGNGVRDMFLENRQTSGPLNPGQLTPMGRLRPEQANEFRTGNANSPTTGQPRYFYLEASNIVFCPAPTQDAWIRFGIPVRPGNMVLPTTARQLASVTPSGPNAFAVTWTGALSFTSGLIDVIASGSPFEYLGLNITATGITTTAATLSYVQETAGNLLYVPQVGDWITVSGQSPVVQLPSEAQQLLVQRGAEYCLRFLGYLEEAAAAKNLGDTMEQSLAPLLTPRTPGNPRKLTGGLQKMIGRGWGTYGWWS